MEGVHGQVHAAGRHQGSILGLCRCGLATLVETLKKAGDDLTRENIMKVAASWQGLKIPLLLPGITINTSPTDFYPIQSEQLAIFKGERFELVGNIISNESK